MRMASRLKRAACGAIVAAAALATGATAASATGAYIRTGIGFDWAGATVFSDRDCNAVAPPALFGCSTGNDGLPIGAYGSFGLSSAFEFAVGFSPAPAIRFEAALSLRPGFAFVGDANFRNTPEPQPVGATLVEAALMGWAYVDLGAAAGASWPVEPFIGFGFGVSRNALSPMLYEFPGLTQPAWSRTPGGTRFSPALGFALGVARRLGPHATVELAFRHVNYGPVATDVGDLVSRRGGPVFLITIDETHAMLATNAVMLSVRWRVRN